MSKELDEKGRPAVYDRLKKKKKPVTRRVPIVLDSELADEFNNLQARVEILKKRFDLDPANKELATELTNAESQLERLTEANRDNIEEFVFRSIGRQAYDDLISDHPPTKAQIAEAKKNGEDPPSWNDETFPPALVHAALVSPELEFEDVEDIWKSPDWNHAELLALVFGAMEVNQNRRVVDLKKGSTLTTD